MKALSIVSLLMILSFSTKGQFFPSVDYNLLWSKFKITTQEVNQDNKKAILVATNRILKKDESGNQIFGDKLGEKLQYLIAYPNDHNNQWKIEILESYEEGVNKIGSTEKKRLFFIHGDGKNLPLALIRANNIQKKFNVQIILFDYPSYSPDLNPYRNFRQSKRNIKESIPFFHQFLKGTDQLFSNKETGSILFHSLGNSLLRNYLLRYNQEYFKSFDNIILSASTTPSRKHNRWLSKLEDRNEVFVLYNKEDFMLKMLKLFQFKNMLGLSPKKRKVHGVKYINLSSYLNSIHTGFDHKMILNYNDKLYDLYFKLFHGKNPNHTNPKSPSISAIF